MFDILQRHLKRLADGKRLSAVPQDSPFTNIAKKIALSPTMPRLISWAGVATRAKGLTIGLVGLLAVMTILWRFGIASLELYVMVLAYIALDLVLTLSPIVSERVTRAR